MVGAVAAALCALALLGGCFESGPLGSDDSTVSPSDVHGVPGPDVSVVPDGSPSDTGAPPADIGGRDVPGLDVPDVPVGPPCLIDSDCTQPDPPDLCLGPLSCIGYACQHAPTNLVTCAKPDTACQEIACNPSSGMCVTTQLCACEPRGTLVCGAIAKFSTADPGQTFVLQDYPCGGGGGASTEHVYLFEVTESQGVRFDAQTDKLSGVWVVGYDGATCHASQCVASGKQSAAFLAQAGVTYAVVVEHGDDPTQVSLVAQCGISVEVNCIDGSDDDLDGATDCDDSDCASHPSCPAQSETACSDHIDEDEDGATDCDDSDCDTADACLESCFTTIDASCSFNQGGTTGGGKAFSTHYNCVGAPQAPGKEVVHRLTVASQKQVNVMLSGAGPGLGIYVLEDKGLGCTPKHCAAYHPTNVTFLASPGTIYYVVVDNAVDDTPAEIASPAYSVDFTCTP